MKKIIFISIILNLMLVCQPSAGGKEDIIKDVEGFSEEILSVNKKPSLSVFYKYFGNGSEYEIEIANEICLEQSLLPIDKSQKCTKFIESRERQPDETESLFLLWIRKKLPLSPSIKIEKVELFKDKSDGFKYELITALLNDEEVKFFKPVDPRYVQEFGLLSIAEINKVSIRELFENDYLKGR